MVEIRLKGISISSGIAMGPLYFLKKDHHLVPDHAISKEERPTEIERFKNALLASCHDIKILQKNLEKEDSLEAVEILHAHLEMLKDPFILQEVTMRIQRDLINAEKAFFDVMSHYRERLDVDDPIFQDRLYDLQDITKRVLGHMHFNDTLDLNTSPPGSIIVSEEIVPSSIAEADPAHTLAFVTKLGGKSSHAAIIARAKGIPFVAGIDLDKIPHDALFEFIVDGNNGEVIMNPSEKTKAEYEHLQLEHLKYFELMEKEGHLLPETLDGYPVNIYGNIENLSDIEKLKNTHASGVGLFRSEYLFISKNVFPTEEEQFEAYAQITKRLPNQPVIIRIFDVGGDKQQDQKKDPFERELNPVLGCRAIRYLFRYEKVFKSQLRALLKAASFGNLQILVPMVSDISEIRVTKKLIEEVRNELKNGGYEIKDHIPLGCMIEVPSSAIMSDVIAKEVDFLSIGTNDLIQYVIAADRSNPQLNYLTSHAHPSILRLLRVIVAASSRNKKKLILCGEMASDEKMIPLLLGLGIRDLSVGARYIPLVKNMIRKTSIVKASQFAERALECASLSELHHFVYSEAPEMTAT